MFLLSLWVRDWAKFGVMVGFVAAGIKLIASLIYATYLSFSFQFAYAPIEGVVISLLLLFFLATAFMSAIIYIVSSAILRLFIQMEGFEAVLVTTLFGFGLFWIVFFLPPMWMSKAHMPALIQNLIAELGVNVAAAALVFKEYKALGLKVPSLGN